MLEKIRSIVQELRRDNTGGHSMNHIDRVYSTAMKFCDAEGGDRAIIGLAALLHDVDEWKVIDKTPLKDLSNAKTIMDKCDVPENVREAVLEIIRTMGFSNALAGIMPTTLEGRIVSDADMCDAGASGIIRVAEVGANNKRKFFDRNIWPEPEEKLTVEKYRNVKSSTTINHFFEKILRLKSYMHTESGKIRQIENSYFIVSFLRQYFTENNAPEWVEYLDKYLSKHSISAWKK